MSAAFDVSSRLCYLQPVTATVASWGTSLVTVDVYNMESGIEHNMFPYNTLSLFVE